MRAESGYLESEKYYEKAKSVSERVGKAKWTCLEGARVGKANGRTAALVFKVNAPRTRAR